jgi:predicted nucleotidyltransferase
MDKNEEMVGQLKDFFMANAACFGIEIAFLYGSWAIGFSREDSDIDLALIFSKESPSDVESFKPITKISYLLTRELNREVSIIQIYWDFRKPMLYYNAIISGVPLYIKDFDRYVRLKNQAIYQMEDFSIFGLNWQYEVAVKNMEALRHA